MDQIIAALSFEEDGDLRLCVEDGIAYQHDQTTLVDYDAAYFQKYVQYTGSDVSNKINAGRVEFVNKYVPTGTVVDIGIGSGEFITSRGRLTWGYDVNPVAARWLLHRNLWADGLSGFDGYTMFDVIEHCRRPSDYFEQIKTGGYLFTSIPIYDAIRNVRASKHYRPNEHLYHFERKGFIWWMGLHGFALLETRTFEIDAGREAIESFAFWRV